MSDGSPGASPEPQRFENHYTQVNIMFPASEVELPAADKYNAFPPEAQKAILVGFQREQGERHAWLKNQQRNDHLLNLNAQRNAFISQNLGTVCGFTVILTMIILGAMLLLHGVSAAGFTMIVTAVGGVIGVAIYGHRETAKPAPKKPAPKKQDKLPDSQKSQAG